MEAIVRAVQPHEARVNVTYAGQNGDLPDPVSFDANDGDIKQWLTEAISNGGIPGIPEVQADLRDFVVDRFTATETRPYNLLQVRPKTPFGALSIMDLHLLGKLGELVDRCTKKRLMELLSLVEEG